jgi:hypothetical protein
MAPLLKEFIKMEWELLVLWFIQMPIANIKGNILAINFQAMEN